MFLIDSTLCKHAKSSSLRLIFIRASGESVRRYDNSRSPAARNTGNAQEATRYSTVPLEYLCLDLILWTVNWYTYTYSTINTAIHRESSDAYIYQSTVITERSCVTSDTYFHRARHKRSATCGCTWSVNQSWFIFLNIPSAFMLENWIRVNHVVEYGLRWP